MTQHAPPGPAGQELEARRKHRWLNIVGAGDFDGDGGNEIAVVITPHIGASSRTCSPIAPWYWWKSARVE